MTEVSDQQINEAIDRIARTADGHLLHLHLQKVLMGQLAEADPSDGTLRMDHGRRRFASELMARMAKGIEESADRADRTLVTFRTQHAVRTAGRESPRAHIRSTDPEFTHLASADGAGRA